MKIKMKIIPHRSQHDSACVVYVGGCTASSDVRQLDPRALERRKETSCSAGQGSYRPSDMYQHISDRRHCAPTSHAGALSWRCASQYSTARHSTAQHSVPARRGRRLVRDRQLRPGGESSHQSQSVCAAEEAAREWGGGGELEDCTPGAGRTRLLPALYADSPSLRRGGGGGSDRVRAPSAGGGGVSVRWRCRNPPVSHATGTPLRVIFDAALCFLLIRRLPATSEVPSAGRLLKAREKKPPIPYGFFPPPCQWCGAGHG